MVYDRQACVLGVRMHHDRGRLRDTGILADLGDPLGALDRRGSIDELCFGDRECDDRLFFRLPGDRITG